MSESSLDTPLHTDRPDDRQNRTGPRYTRRYFRDGAAKDLWPRWSDVLPGENAQRLEGGQRRRGDLRSGDATAPLVSYVTVVKNNASGLSRAIASVREQTYPDVEHIVIDGASTDGTVGVLEENGEALAYFASERDTGLYAAMNKAVPLARGQLICVLNSDDWLEPTAAETAVKCMRDANGSALLFSGANVAQSKHTWKPQILHPGCWFELANVCHNAMYASPAAYEDVGPYDASLKIAADFKWIMTGIDAGVWTSYTATPTLNYSLGGASSDQERHRTECLRVVEERFSQLTSTEARFLHDCFYQFGDGGRRHGSPARRTRILHELVTSKSDQSDLIEALFWASLDFVEFPRFMRFGRKRHWMERIKGKIKPFGFRPRAE